MFKKARYAVILIMCVCLACPVSAKGGTVRRTSELSPAIEILKSNRRLIKTCAEGGVIRFCERDFSDGAGIEEIQSISVASLPTVADGVLKFGGLDAFVGQVISKRGLDELVFYPSFGCTSTVFTFTVNGLHDEIKCCLFVTSADNEPPASESIKLSTMRGMAAFSSMRAYDPDGDAVEFTVVSQPKKGLLRVSDTSCGQFVYTPRADASGSDSFTYRVRDKYGNMSDIATVSIKIEKNPGGIVYSDMVSHPAAYAAVKMAQAGVLVGEKIGDEMIFSPQREVSRLDFLVMAMKSAGYSPNVYTQTDTGFIDDASITPSQKGYVITAQHMAVPCGVETPDGDALLPDKAITLAEAAVIINAILSLEPAKAVFSYSDDTPDWAAQAVGAMYSAGMLTTPHGDEAMIPLTRALAVQILYETDIRS